MRARHDPAEGLHLGKASALPGSSRAYFAEWDTESDIEFYHSSDAHKEIVRHTRALKGSSAEVKLYDPVT